MVEEANMVMGSVFLLSIFAASIVSYRVFELMGLVVIGPLFVGVGWNVLLTKPFDKQLKGPNCP